MNLSAGLFIRENEPFQQAQVLKCHILERKNKIAEFIHMILLPKMAKNNPALSGSLRTTNLPLLCSLIEIIPEPWNRTGSHH